MKKVLALVLAVMMMATVAFAAVVTQVAPGSKLTLPLSSVPGATTMNYGSSDTVTVSATSTPWSTNKEIVGKNFSISNIKWTKGSAQIASVSINSDDEIVIEFKQDYTLTKLKPVEGSFKVVQKGTGVSNTVTIGATALNVAYKTGYLAIDSTGAVVATEVYDAGTAVVTDEIAAANYGDYAFTVKAVKAGTAPGSANMFGTAGASVPAGQAYGTWAFNAANGVTVEGKIYDGDKLFLANSNDPDLAVVKAAPDDADLRFASFDALTLNSTGTLYFYDASEDDIVYQIGSNGRLNKVGSWNEDEGCYIVKARTLGSYVISDVKLATAATTETPDNPDTGANDVVGIATALAAVALVSAAAVSLKK